LNRDIIYREGFEKIVGECVGDFLIAEKRKDLRGLRPRRKSADPHERGNRRKVRLKIFAPATLLGRARRADEIFQLLGAGNERGYVVGAPLVTHRNGTVRESDNVVDEISFVALEVFGTGGFKRSDYAERAALEFVGECLFELGKRERREPSGVMADDFKHKTGLWKNLPPPPKNAT